MDIVSKQISELKPAEYNPRQLSEKQFEDLKKSFQNLGTLEPAVINQYPGRENVIISGHQRLKVATSLGMVDYPCYEVSFPPEKEKEANIRMNRNTGEWSFDELANNFDVADLVKWGFNEDELIKDNDLPYEGESIDIPQSVQLEPPKEYILIMAEPNSIEWEEMKETLKLKIVKRGGYKKGSPFDVNSIERVIWWGEFKERCL